LSRYIFVFIFFAAQSLAHDARPIYLEINENDRAQPSYEVKTKIPDSLNFFPEASLPGDCKLDAPLEKERGSGFSVLRTQFSCSEMIQGKLLTIDFPEPNPSLSILIRISSRNGEVHTRLLSPSEFEWLIPEAENISSIAKEYTDLGIRHISGGYDHLLFVLCLFFVVILREQKKWRTLFLTVTGFTLAHSFTLAFSVFDLITLPILFVEALIALSITFLALELTKPDKKSLTFAYPSIVAVAFGLLHGFGFASVLKSIGLPQSDLLVGLLFFNLGVEIGQLIFLFSIGFISLSFVRISMSLEKQSVLIAYTAGASSAYWFIDRLMGFFSI